MRRLCAFIPLQRFKYRVQQRILFPQPTLKKKFIEREGREYWVFVAAIRPNHDCHSFQLIRYNWCVAFKGLMPQTSPSLNVEALATEYIIAQLMQPIVSLHDDGICGEFTMICIPKMACWFYDRRD
jgi:hypothetical protein